MYVCIVFSMVRLLARLRITLTVRRTAHLKRAEVALTNSADSSSTHTSWKKRKQIKERQEQEREARQNESSEIQKSKDGDKNNLKKIA